MCAPVHAGTITMPQYNTGDTVTATNQNTRFNLSTNILNGGLDNENADVEDGFRFIEVLEALPAAGIQGRVVFLTSNNTLNFDTGLTYLATALLNNTQTFTGTNTFSGATIFNGTLDANSTTTLAGTNTLSGSTTVSGVLSATNDVTLGAGSGDSITFNANDGLTFTPAATWTFSDVQTISGTWADLGSVTTVDINGGTLDGVQIGGTTATGELIVNNSSDDADGLGAQGTSGQFLQSAGVGVNPTFANLDFELISVTTVSGAQDSGDIAIEPSKQYYVTIDIVNTAVTATFVDLRINDGTSGYAWSGQGTLMSTAGTITNDGDDSDGQITLMKDTTGYVTDMVAAAQNGFLRGNMYIDTNKVGTSHSAFVTGEFVAIDTSGLVSATFGGIKIGNITVADFQIITEQNVNMTINTYELIQSL